MALSDLYNPLHNARLQNLSADDGRVRRFSLLRDSMTNSHELGVLEDVWASLPFGVSQAFLSEPAYRVECFRKYWSERGVS